MIRSTAVKPPNINQNLTTGLRIPQTGRLVLIENRTFELFFASLRLCVEWAGGRNFQSAIFNL
jgi:DNA-binding transcriptional regulator YdaS (Cro superfamily)